MDVVLPKPGSYVLAVSGGVDSMVLLNLLHRQNTASEIRPWKLVVAHLDHGIRPDSPEDRKLVQATARQLDLPFVYHESKLGPGTSEATARTARYGFLRQVRQASGARAIVTAHHQDDLLETAILNILRGTGRKGLTALSNRHDMARPLLGIPKRDLVAYARDQNLQWREDSTNQDQMYLRNYIRHRILPRFDQQARARLEEIITKLQTTNHELDTLLANQLHTQPVGGALERQWFNHLPHAVAREVMAAWLRAHSLRNFDSKTLERLVVAAKVSRPGSRLDAGRGTVLLVGTNTLALDKPER
ncbi:MAG TPA: tRNA lysidine(34) synthetase TilS [Verrucomicrobiae bacterium]|jgi:tRNA(Ile)-lysidine synthase|nr:tRNA lysidine(34) synthetase TilS [Verrucomicrobiae bacterium]